VSEPDAKPVAPTGTSRTMRAAISKEREGIGILRGRGVASESNAASNGEVERPADHASLARLARNIDRVQPRPTTGASRPAPTIVRSTAQRTVAVGLPPAQTLPGRRWIEYAVICARIKGAHVESPQDGGD